MLYNILKPLVWIFMKFVFLFKVKNKPKNIPEGRLILCANHLSNFDVLLLLINFPKKVYFMAKKELFSTKFSNWFFRQCGAFPIDRSVTDLDAIRTSSKILKDEKVLGIFPEGTRNKDGKISRENFNNGIAMIAVKNNANILTASIRGHYKLFSKIEIIFNDIIHIENFEGENKKDLYNNIVDKVYEDIYKNL